MNDEIPLRYARPMPPPRTPLLTMILAVAIGVLGGLSIFLAGDVRLAHTEATFHLAYPKVDEAKRLELAAAREALGGAPVVSATPADVKGTDEGAKRDKKSKKGKKGKKSDKQ